MNGRQTPLIAGEGFPYVVAGLAATGATWYYLGSVDAIVPAVVVFWLFLIFRDPARDTPAVPLGVVSPVDGEVVEVSLTDRSALGGEAHRILIRINSLGTYTARCPVEGKINDIRGSGNPESGSHEHFRGLWVRTDENEDIVLQFHGHRLGLAPTAFLGFGERVGQGQRCAYLRLTRVAEVQLPVNSRIMVTTGQRVKAGADLLARLPHG